MWLSRNTERLFAKVSMHQAIEHQRDRVKKHIDTLSPDTLKAKSDEQLKSELVSNYTISVPTLDETSISSSSPREIDVEVHDMFDGLRRVRGVEVTLMVPYKGDDGLFYVQPSTYDTSGPRANVSKQHLSFPYQGREVEADKLKSEFASDLNDIKRFLDWQRENVQKFNTELPGVIVSQLSARRAKLGKAADAVASLGFPIKD
jgi:hypothetical protein